MRRWLVVLLALLASSTSAWGQAPDLERAKASFKAGASAYAAGDYLAAIQALDIAYELSPLPAIAFSLAQAERKQYFRDGQRAHLERALLLFHRYIDQEPLGNRREDASLAISQLEPLLERPERSSPAVAAPEARPTRLMIVSDAPGARISLDGAPSAPSPLIREVGPGQHSARVEAPGFFPSERSMTALAGELLLTEVRLSERPASLYVWAPDGADVYVDGVFIGQGGKRLLAQLPNGRHQLIVGKKGYQLVRRDFTLSRGQAHGESVSLFPTAQRKISRAVFIGSGATLSAGILLAAFAIRSENQAETFLARSKHRNVSGAALASYKASIADRNRYRAAATASIAGASALFVTGLFLKELDRPSIPALTRGELQASPVAPAASSEALRVGFAPEAVGADVGGSLLVHF